MKAMEMRISKVGIGRVTAVGVASLALTLGSSMAAHADGDGDCSDAGNICVYDAQQPTDFTDGYYDLYYDRPNFHGDYWILGDNGYIGDDISAASNSADTPTSCAGFTFWWNVSYDGTSYFASRNFSYLTFYDNNNEFSSFKRTGC
jgi:hypothetical protein